MSRSYKTTGIVIGRRDLGEADRLVVLITSEHGKLKAVVRGARKAKSRLAGHVELFARTELVLAQGKSLDVVTGARLLSFPHGLLERPEALSFAYIAASALDRLVPEAVEAPRIYALMEEALEAASALDGYLPVIELAFKLRLADAMGYRPELSACQECHTNSPDVSYRFDPERGGIACEHHAGITARSITLSQIKLWRLVLTHHMAKIGELGGAVEAARETLPLVNEFFEQHIGYRFETGLLAPGHTA